MVEYSWFFQAIFLHVLWPNCNLRCFLLVIFRSFRFWLMILWDSLRIASLEDTVPRWLLGKNDLIPKWWLSAEDLWCSLWWLAAFVWDQWCNCISSNPAIVICVATSPLVAASVSWTVAAAPVAAPECCVKWWKLGCGDPAMGCTCCTWFFSIPFVTLFENKCTFNMEAKWTWGWPLGKIIFKNLRFWGNYAYSMSSI